MTMFDPQNGSHVFFTVSRGLTVIFLPQVSRRINGARSVREPDLSLLELVRSAVGPVFLFLDMTIADLPNYWAHRSPTLLRSLKLYTPHSPGPSLNHLPSSILHGTHRPPSKILLVFVLWQVSEIRPLDLLMPEMEGYVYY